MRWKNISMCLVGALVLGLWVPQVLADVELVIAEDGTMSLNADMASLAGYSLRSPGGSIIPDADDNAAPFSFYLLNIATEVTAGNIGSSVELDGDLTLDVSWTQPARDAVFEYSLAGQASVISGMVTYVPEPASLVLLAGGLVLLRRRH